MKIALLMTYIDVMTFINRDLLDVKIVGLLNGLLYYASDKQLYTRMEKCSDKLCNVYLWKKIASWCIFINVS